MYGIYLTRNGTTANRKQYPIVSFDMTAAAGFSTIIGAAITPPAGTSPTSLMAYNIVCDSQQLIPQMTAAFNPDELIRDPRSTEQPYYYPADKWRDCFSDAVQLSGQPDDWTVQSGNNWRYYQQVNAGSGGWFVTQPQAFAAGTYYVCDTISGLYESDNGLAFGASMGYVPRSGTYIFDGLFGHKWMCDAGGNLAEYWQYYWPQMPSYHPESSSYRIIPTGWNCEFNQNTVGFNTDPDTPSDSCCMMCRGVYNGVTYLGLCFYKFDPDNMDILSFRCQMFPDWCWGGVEPYVPPEPPTPDIPEAQDYGEDSWTGGGGGTLSDTNDFPSIGTVTDLYDAFGNYNIRIYRMSQNEYGEITNLLWGTGTDHDALWNRWQNYRFSPIQSILLNHFIPISFVPTCTNRTNIRLGGVQLMNTADVPDHQFKDFEVGTLSIPEFFGTALDYSPYTVTRLYLPFCGWIDVDPDRVVGGSLKVTYRCDITTGDVCAYVQCTDRTGQTTYLYTATGNCSITMPVTGNDQGTGQMISSLSSAAMGAITGNVLGVASGLLGAVTAQQHTQITGSVSGSTAAVADKQCRLQIIRPVPSNPAFAQALRGRPSDVGVVIGSLVGTGWSAFSAVHPEIEGATAAECEEIVQLLADGIIL